MPVKRLFSTSLEDDVSTILPTFGCYLMSPRTDRTTSDESCWLSTDDEDSGLGPDEVFTNDKTETPPTKRPKMMTTMDDILTEGTYLIADGSRCYSLPTVTGKHTDIKSISPETLSDVISGRYDDVINTYRVIDCRYPYEFDGGHLKNAENRYLHSMITDLLQQPPEQNQVIIFHCEFSQERGPAMLRFLRSKDRGMNSDNYPALNFPELYLVDGGYKSIYQVCPSMCEPVDYRPMIHSDFSSELHHFRRATDVRHFRAKSKSWSAGDKTQLARKVIF